MEILQSASKIVFLLMAITSCAGFLMQILPVTDFKFLVGLAFAYYFTQKIPGAISNGTTKGSG